MEKLRQHAAAQPDHIAVQGTSLSLSYRQLHDEISVLGEYLPGHCLGLLLDNDPAWAVADLAALSRDIVCVPLPPFFSDSQLVHALRDAGTDMVLTDQSVRLKRLCPVKTITSLAIAGYPLHLIRLDNAGKKHPGGVAKITYTSGTTGAPKGVRLGHAAMTRVAQSLCTVVGATGTDVSLALTPLSTLLENIGGLYALLLAGGQACLPPLCEVGIGGAVAFDVVMLIGALQRFRPSSVILVPQMLKALVAAAELGFRLPDSLRIMAVGGAPVAPSLLRRAANLGLPVFQGYGLSEASSVVCLDFPGSQRVGSVGKPLPHARVRIAADGEILVTGSLFDGYAGQAEGLQLKDGYWPTGDLGYVDDAGFLYLSGRKKNLFITSFGRNVAPEWVECELLAHPAVIQAAVFGEARPYNVAVIVARNPPEVATAVADANRRLPDYARITKYLLAAEPFSTANGELTGTGRPRRAVIYDHYAESIDALYHEVA